MKKPKPKDDPKVRTIAINKPKGDLKLIAGSMADDWNMRQLINIGRALPVNYSDINASNAAIAATCQGIVDLAPADPVEGILIGQLMVANEAALAMYQKGWAQPPEYFEARTKYLQLADKATRTVLMLTERLDHHRGRGQQQITVKHVTVNADNAIVGDVTQAPGGGAQGEIKDQPHALGHAIQPALWGKDPPREPVPVASDGERTLPDARRPVTGRSERK